MTWKSRKITRRRQNPSNRGMSADIRRAFRANDTMDVLVNQSFVQSGPFDGGCLIVAKALYHLFPEGELVHIANEFGEAEHYGLRMPDGSVIDAAGVHPSETSWIQYMEQEELMKHCCVVQRGIGKDIGLEIDDPAAVKSLIPILRKHLRTF